ncbi:hypothetical protein FUAX_31530 [Fulvitalea axinellae]|uniref:Carbohydrate-binding domain-containing protein n=1 Tax=Fulvitalea axinellae TaxID=1182444 RepID=A0AAU9DC64_9BACT|nr:hypothetical protein FUAX_31530 [Fulvitalea axinellae]
MRELSFVKIPAGVDTADLKAVSEFLSQKCDTHKVDNTPWPEQFPYKPEVSFSGAHDGKAVYLRFDVNEQQILATNTEINQEVYQDSCVEFFIAVDDESYYNFEFNAVGTCLGGFHDAERDYRLHEDLLSGITTLASLGEGPIDKPVGGEWNLTVRIPSGVLEQHSGFAFGGNGARANFYKCGDNHKTPHFVSWNMIEFEKPNFHLPEFFGKVTFE